MTRKVKNMLRRSVGEPVDEAIEPEEVADASTHYTASNGAQHLIREMPDGYIHNAVAKLRRSPFQSILTRTTIEAMDKEIARREQTTGEEENS